VTAATLRGGVIAAGEGRRLHAAGGKALAEVSGRPLLEHVLRRYEAAGILEVALIFRADAARLEAFVRERFPRLRSRVLLRSTASSAESFAAVLEMLGPGRSVLSTVDTVCPPEAFLGFVRRARSLPEDALVLAVTPTLEDEKPLRVRVAEGGRVVALGGDEGPLATAGFYVVPHALRDLYAQGAPWPALRALLGAWVASGRPTSALDVGPVLDVDRPEDLRRAEALLAAAAPRAQAKEPR
jgi:NDP-sugar pyrophosphorylase family protein